MNMQNSEASVISIASSIWHSVCRVCRGRLFPESLLRYTNMPAMAQELPSRDKLADDGGTDLQVCQCSDCGLVQLSNEPVSYYRDVIRAAAFSEDMRAFRLEQFAVWAQKFRLEGRNVLEVGCGRGEYLSLLQSVGIQVHGVENAIASIKNCESQGFPVTQGFLGDGFFKIADGAFDGFVCLNFMEHWPDPGLVLQGIRHNLADQAIGLVEVPNFDMIIDKGLFSEFISDHLLYFTQDTLRLTLQMHGFDVLECKPVWQDYILSAVVRKRSRTRLDFFEKFRSDITSQLNHYISDFPSGKVAIWGAGHQALAVIALAKLGNKIAYVVDSALFKQGKYTPATHLPIVAPQQLAIQPMDAIIIMAASYSDEVARLIREQHGAAIRVAILRDYGLEDV